MNELLLVSKDDLQHFIRWVRMRETGKEWKKGRKKEREVRQTKRRMRNKACRTRPHSEFTIPTICKSCKSMIVVGVERWTNEQILGKILLFLQWIQLTFKSAFYGSFCSFETPTPNRANGIFLVVKRLWNEGEWHGLVIFVEIKYIEGWSFRTGTGFRVYGSVCCFCF